MKQRSTTEKEEKKDENDGTKPKEVKRRRIIKNNKRDNNYIIEYLFHVIRVFGILLWLCTYLSLYILLPLLPLNILLRRMGVVKDNYLDVALKLWARGFLWVSGTKVVPEVSQKIPKDLPTVMMFNHTSFYDPFAVACFSPVSLKCVFKRELIFYLPFLFVYAWLIGNIPINRSKRDSAISILQRAAKVAKANKLSIAVSPEGTRSKDGTLQPFKKGPFYLAIDTGVKHVVPVVLHNAIELWPPGQIFPSSGTIWIKFMDPIPMEGETVESLSDKVQDIMQKEIDRFNAITLNRTPTNNTGPAFGFLIFAIVVGLYVYNWHFL